MGIATYFRKILEDYPDVHFWKCDMEVDNLLIDFNSMIYQVINILNDELGNMVSKISAIDYENKLVDRIIRQLQHVICEVIRPNKMVYIAVDGPPPFAKMIQQRARRYKTIKEHIFRKELEKKYKMSIPVLQWNKNAISPGTTFMIKLSKLIIHNIQQRNFQIHNRKLVIIFSDDTIPGEGEHKLMPSIRRLKTQEGGNTVIYSPDADLIVLSVMSDVNNIYILREPKDSEVELKYYSSHEFLYLDIDKCRKEFCNQMYTGIGIQERYYKEILRDYTFLTFFCGNDFVVAAPFLKIKEGGIQLLIDAHKKIFTELNGELDNIETYQFLVGSNNEINNVFLLKLMKLLYIVEEERLRKWQRKRDKIRQGIRPSKKEMSENNKEPWELELSRFSHEEYYSPYHPYYEHFNRVFDRIDYYSDEWNNQYNMHFFGNEDINNVCLEYYKSLNFCLKYYYEGVPSWKWHYKYRAAPSIKQFSEYLEGNFKDLSISWDLSRPCKPFEQLMYILPKSSFKLLPKILNDNELDKYYPNNFILDIIQGTKFIYSEPILPNIPLNVIENKINRMESKFTDKEKERNMVRNKPYIYKPN